MSEPLQDVSPSGKNVGQLESIISATFGGALIVRALLPRTLPQTVLLLLGAGLLYRGLTSNCKLYSALGIDTEKNSLVDQLKTKVFPAH